MPDGRRKRGPAAIVLLGFVLSTVLIFLLLRSLPFDGATYARALEKARWTGLMGILLSTVFHCWISGEKWRYVTRLTSRGTDLGRGYYFYSALIGLLGQVLPLQIAMVTGRAFALRLHAKVPLRKGAGSTIYDQCFDILVPASLMLSTALAATSVLTLEAAGLLAMFCTVGVGVVLACSGEKALTLVLRPMLRLMPNMGDNALESGLHLAGRRPLATLYLMSLLRFANLAFRAWLVAWTLNLKLSWLAVLFASCGVTFSLIFAFAPGALGVVEWGWVGMLHLFGASSSDAAQFALSSRLFSLTALLVINLVHALLLVAYWAGRTRGSNVESAR